MEIKRTSATDSDREWLESMESIGYIKPAANKSINTNNQANLDVRID